MPKTKDLSRAIDQAKAEVSSSSRRSARTARIAERISQNDTVLDQLVPFRSKGEAAAKPMSAEETAIIDTEFAKWRKYWVERRKLYQSSVSLMHRPASAGTLGQIAESVQVDGHLGGERYWPCQRLGGIAGDRSGR